MSAERMTANGTFETFRLRAAIGLSRAWAAKGAPEEGIAQLQEVVCAFSGDDGPRELAIARQILSDHSH